MSREKTTNEGADLGSEVDALSRASKGPFRSHLWRYRWIYFLIIYLPVIIPVFYVSITDADDPFFSGSFFSDSLNFFWSIAGTSMVFLWAFSMFYLLIGKLVVGKKWLFALVFCPPLVFVYFLKDRD